MTEDSRSTKDVGQPSIENIQLGMSKSNELSNEKVLFLLNKFTGVSPYWHEFVSEGLDPQILSGFVSALSSFMNEMTGAEQSKWTTAYGRDSTLLVEEGEWIIGVVAVARETSEARSRLRRLVIEFEESFAALRMAESIRGGIFNDFDQFVKRVFVDARLSEHSIVLRKPDWRSVSKRYELPSIAFKVTRFLFNMTNGQSVADIAAAQGLSIDEVKNIISIASWNKTVSVLYLPSNDDILMLSNGSSSDIFKQGNPLQLSTPTLKLLAIFDGQTALSTAFEKANLHLTKDELVEIALLINMGYVQRIPLEHKLVLVHKCVLSELLQACINAMGIEKTQKFVHQVYDSGIENHPWLTRIRLSTQLDIQFTFNESVTPSDLDDIYDAFEFMTNRLVNQLDSKLGAGDVRALLEVVKKQCHQIWGAFVIDSMV